MTESPSPSLSTATYLDKALAIGYGRQVILGRFSAVAADVGTCVDTTIINDEDGMVRTVAFLPIPDGPLCLVSAGDGKKIHVYNLSSSEEDQERRVSVTTPCYSFGPHTKRITHLATNSEGTIVFADKFGEVYRLRLCWSPEHHVEPDGDTASPASFLLQHLSMFTCLFLSSPIRRMEKICSTEERDNTFCRRLFTCDKDARVRCSRFPETYVIEQYLWRKLRPTAKTTANTDDRGALNVSPVTVMTEIPAAGSLSLCASGASVGAVMNRGCHALSALPTSPSSTSVVETAAGGLDYSLSSLCNCPSHQQECLDSRSFYVLGHHDGSISFWNARNDLGSNSPDNALEQVWVYTPGSLSSPLQTEEQKQESTGGVVGLCYAVSAVDAAGYSRHPEDCVRGVFAAHDHSCEVLFFPLFSSTLTEGCRPHVVLSKVSKVTLPHPVVALKRCSSNTAVVITRAGTIHFVELMPSNEVEKDKDMAAQEWKIHIREDYKMEDMQCALRRMIRDETPARTSQEGLSKVNSASGVSGAGRKAKKSETGSSVLQELPTDEEEDLSGLASLDLWAEWQKEVITPFKRKRAGCDDDGGDGEEDDEDNDLEDSTKSPKKKVNNKKKVNP